MRNKQLRIKKIMTGLVTIIVVVGLIILSQMVKNRGGVNISCDSEHPVADNLVCYRQDDAQWKDEKLGESKYTMKSSGCITTCIASAISVSEEPMDPGELVKMLSDKGVFDGAGNMQWGKVDEIPGFHAEVFSTPNQKDIENCLAEGRYPIVKIHRKSLFSYHHFVLIVGSKDGEYICMDPLKDSLTKLSDYGNRIYSVRCVWHD